MKFDFDVHAAVQFYPWCKFCLALFLGMVMYDKQNTYTPIKERKEIVALSGSLKVSISLKACDKYQETNKMLFKQQKSRKVLV